MLTKPDRYPVPHSHDISAKLHGKSTFPRLEFVKAFNHTPMNAGDIEKTAVATPFGLYEWLYMSFGLDNANATLQRCLANIFLDVECICIYTNDILIFSKDSQ